MVFSDHEVDALVPIISKAARGAFSAAGHRVANNDPGCDIGAMIELPRACLRAERIVAAKHISFVSFGTNDLTQMVFGLSRDDTQAFMVITSNQNINTVLINNAPLAFVSAEASSRKGPLHFNGSSGCWGSCPTCS